jgi:hypothetical protein
VIRFYCSAWKVVQLTSQPLTQEQALFFATLPDVFCNLAYAIRTHAFINRVAVIDEGGARHAIEYGLGAKVVETDGEGQVRLADHLRRVRDKLEASEGFFEVAVFEVSRAIMKQAGQTAPE